MSSSTEKRIPSNLVLNYVFLFWFLRGWDRVYTLANEYELHTFMDLRDHLQATYLFTGFCTCTLQISNKDISLKETIGSQTSKQHDEKDFSAKVYK